MISVILLVIGVMLMVLNSFGVVSTKVDLWKLAWAFVVASFLPWGR